MNKKIVAFVHTKYLHNQDNVKAIELYDDVCFAGVLKQYQPWPTKKFV